MTYRGIRIEQRPNFLPSAWMALDGNGVVIACGMLGLGSYPTPGADTTRAAVIQCGTAVYEEMRKGVDRLTTAC